MKRKSLWLSILTIVMCLSLTVGATFALFTSESDIDISVSSGKVEISAKIDRESIQTKELYTDYAAGDDNMFEGTATFDADGNLTLTHLVPGDGITFNIVVHNGSNVTTKYRTIIACVEDNGLYNGLKVDIAGIQNYNGEEYVANWAVLEAGSADIIVPVVIELPDAANNNDYQDTSCKLNFFVEAVQGNAKTENVSTPVELDGQATESYSFSTNGADSPVLEASAETLNYIAQNTGNGNVSLKHSEPKVEGSTVTFETMEIVDENNNEVDLSGNTTPMKITLPAQPKLANKTVYVYHDNEYIATVNVGADGVISYQATHLCEVAVSTKILSDKIAVNGTEEFNLALSRMTGDTTIVLNGDIEIAKTLAVNKGVLTIDLNGFDIKADYEPTASDMGVFQVYNKNGLVLKSSKAGAEINAGGHALVLAYGNVEISNVTINVNEIKSSTFQTFKMNTSDLTIGEGVVINVNYLATSLISGGKNVVIDGASINVNTFKTNAGVVISNSKYAPVAIKNSTVAITLDPTYTQYFINWSNGENVVLENNNFIVEDAIGYSYTVEEVTKADSMGYGFKKSAYYVSDAEEIQTAIESKVSKITLDSNVTLEETIIIAEDAIIELDLNGKTITASSYALENYGQLTIVGDGVVNGIVYNEGVMTINGGTYNPASKTSAYTFLNANGGELIINDATINGGTSYPIYSYGDGGTKLVINNATVNATFGCINTYSSDADNSYVEINGGTFSMTGVAGKTSHIAYFSKNSIVTINGGTFKKIGDISMSATGGGGICAINGAQLTINGGNFAGDYADVYNWGGGATIAIKGGTFKNDKSNVAA